MFSTEFSTKTTTTKEWLCTSIENHAEDPPGPDKELTSGETLLLKVTNKFQQSPHKVMMG